MEDFIFFYFLLGVKFIIIFFEYDEKVLNLELENVRIFLVK